MFVSSTGNISTPDKNSEYVHNYNTLLQYPNLTKPNIWVCSSKHNVNYYVTTKIPRAFSRIRQLDYKKLNLAKQEFKFLMDNDIIRPSKSSWASPLHWVFKKAGILPTLQGLQTLKCSNNTQSLSYSQNRRYLAYIKWKENIFKYWFLLRLISKFQLLKSINKI